MIKDRRFVFDNPERIRALREAKGITQQRISVLLNLPQPKISDLELGKRKKLEDAQARKLAHYFRVPVKEFRKQ